MSLFTELKHRGVFQAGVAYTVVAWLLVQVASIIFPAFAAPDWVMQATIILLLIGFPISLLVAWFYDLTSEGVIRAAEGPADEAAKAFPGQTLNYAIISVLAAAVILFALDKFYWKTELEITADDGPRSIAVLPFKNLSGNADNEPFADGIHDDLLTQLSKVQAWRVTSRTSVMQYRDQDLPIPQIADELNVNTVLEGGVQRSANRIRINAQLIDGATDAHLWAETYDRELSADSIFSIQSEISLAIANALRTTLSAKEEEALAAVPTRNLEAYDAYTIARSTMDSNSRQDYDTSISHYRRAIELDPEFAAAWAGMCLSYLSLYAQDSNQAHFDNAQDACNHAQALDASKPEVHIALGTLYRYFGQYSIAEVSLQSSNYAKAEEALQMALNLDDTRVDALIEMGKVLSRQGRLDEAEAHLNKAEQLEPASWFAQTALYSFYYSHSDKPNRFDLAAGHAARSASMRPDLASSWNNLGAANYMMGKYDLAADAWRKSLEIEHNRTGFTNTGLALYYSGDYEAAAQMQRRAMALAPNDHRAAGRLADALRMGGAEEGELRDAYSDAIALARKLLEVNDRDWRTIGKIAYYLACIGSEEAMPTVQRALNLSERRSESLYYLGLVHTLQGEKEEAVNSLVEAIEKDPDFRSLIRTDPDFADLLRDERLASLMNEKRQ